MNHRGYFQVKPLEKVSMEVIGKNGSKVHKVHFVDQTHSNLSANLERLARKSEVYVHINPGCCHEQQEDEGIPENITGLLETTNQRSNSQRNASCNCQQCKPSAGIKCNKHERINQDDGQSNEGLNNAVGLDHILKMRVKIQNLNPCRPGSSQQAARMLIGKYGQGKGECILKSLTIHDTAPNSFLMRAVDLLRVSGNQILGI